MPYPRGIVTILVFTVIVTSGLANGFMRLGSNHLQPKLHVSKRDVSKLEHKWIQQPLDHFDSSEKRTFKMRYYERLDLWQPSGPIYIYIGFDGWYDKNWIASDKHSLICQMAKETNGSLFAIEHRYYGRSNPKISQHNITEYYKFLSSRQALADLANFIKSVKSDPKYKTSKVVVVGNWYAGSLAAWLREFYPDLVDAAIAASAPVLAQKDFKEYYESLTYTYGKYGGEKCLNNMEKKFKRYEKLLQSPDGIETLKKELRICPSSNLTVLENQQWLFYYFIYGLPADYATGATPSKIKSLCNHYYQHRDMFTVDFLKSARSNRLAQGCTDIDFNPAMFNDSDYVYFYQMCSEFGYFHTTTAEKRPFVHWNPLDFEVKFCKAFFKGDVEKRIDEGVARTNMMYGGKHPNVTKVVFTHGDMDPWHTLGVLQDLGPDAPVTMVNGTSQGGVLFVQPFEVEDLKKNRNYVKELIKKWIS